MENRTSADEVIQSFESNFADKHELPVSLEYMWLIKAVARYSTELEEIGFDEDAQEFCCELSQYAIDTLANYMWQLYQEREVSKVNKRVSIIGKDISWNSTGNLNKYNAEELGYISNKSSEMTEHQKCPAYN